MKTKLFLICAIVLSASALGACAAPAPTATPVPPKKVLLIAKAGAFAMELMLTQEVGVMKSMLEKAGYEVVVASPTGQLIKGDSTTLKPDMKLADVKVEDYVGLVIPCMAIESAQPEAVEVAKKAAALGKSIAAQNGSVLLVLGPSGLLNGKQFAVNSGYEKYVPGGVYKGEGVIQDGNLLTSGSCPYSATATRPDTTVELTQKFIALLASAH